VRDEQVVIFRMGEEQYAVPMSTVREIIVPPQIRSVPNAKGHVRGVISLRGKVITVLSLAQLLNLDTRTSDSEHQRHMVVLENEEVLLGIEVDEVKEVLNIAQHKIEQSPAIAGQETFLDGILNLGERLILMLNVKGIFAS